MRSISARFLQGTVQYILHLADFDLEPVKKSVRSVCFNHLMICHVCTFRFSQYAAEWQRAIACISLLDCLGSLAAYSKGLEEGCFPTILEDFSHPVVDIEEGRHPCLDLPGSNYIANNTRIGGDGDASSLIVLTGPNMGGKSTLMRQTGLLVILAQVISRLLFVIPRFS